MTDASVALDLGAHGALPPRGLERTPSSSELDGRFGRMFRDLPVLPPSDASLVKLGESMIQDLENGQLDKALGVDDDDENVGTMGAGLRLPAGYTYFGQFVDHDITFDPVSSLTRQSDPDALVDYRTPRFDLDSLYGRGPSDQPYLYSDGLHLVLGNDLSENPATKGPDLQRVANERATIGDPRNDENLIISQLQSTVIRFHNAVLDRIGNEHPERSKADNFKIAQQAVRWHYQWVVVHDFLPRLVGQSVVDDILKTKPYEAAEGVQIAQTFADLRFFHWQEEPFMPVEFSVAAYRYGHSMVRPSYLINSVAHTNPPVEGASRIPLFSQTGTPTQSLNGFRAVPADWGVQWRFFLEGIKDGLPAEEHLPQPSYKIDAVLSHPLGALPSSTAEEEKLVAGFEPQIAQVLAVRNLLRGKRLELPAGQDVARAMGIEPMSEAELFDGAVIDENAEEDAKIKADLAGRAPLWYYVLKEAEKRSESAHLGPVGGRIVAEVLIGLLDGDPLSYLSVEPNWKPTLPAASAGTFTLSDLINVAIPGPDDPTPPPYGG